MRKLKLLLAACALFGVTATTWAVNIETDLTTQFSSLTDNNSWTTGAGGKAGYTGTQFCPMVTPNGLNPVQVCEFYETTCTREGDILYATVTGLTAGTYKIELYGGAAFTYGRKFGSEAFTGSTETTTEDGTPVSATYSAGQHIDTETGVKLYALSEGVEYGDEIPIYYATDFPDGASTVTIEGVVVGESGTIKIGMKKTSHSTNWHVVQLKSVIATVDAEAAWASLKGQAEALKTQIMNGTVLSELTTAAAATPTTADEYKDAIENLNAKIAAANASIAAYANAKTVIEKLEAVVENTNVYNKTYLDGLKDGYTNRTLTTDEAKADALWVITAHTQNRYTNAYAKLLTSVWKVGDVVATTDGSGFYINGWSNEGASDGSQVTVPFFEYWTGDGNALGAKIFSTTVDGLTPDGQYTVSMLMRTRQQNGQTKADDDVTLTLNDGAAINVADGQQSSVDGYAAMYYKEVVAVGTADAEGKLVIALNVKEDNHISWLAFKNVNVTEFQNIKLSEIVLDQTDATLTTGDELTLTVTSVSPDNADDKTYSWSSTDESVATVTNGKVVALAAGTATIKATANDGGGAEGTCEITVADAAAPANWSDIASVDQGDFFIRNVGTGKFLGAGGEAWGTQAYLVKHGIPFGLNKIEDGKYQLDSYTYKNGNEHFFNGTYVDGGSTPVYVEPKGSGIFAMYTLDGETKKYVTAKAGTTVVDNSAANGDASIAQWQFLSADDMLKNLKEGETDATFFLSEANISRYLRKSNGASAWTGTRYERDGGWDNGFKYGGTNGNQCGETWHAQTNSYQTVSVPNGTYTVRVQGFYRADENSADASYLYANGGVEDVTVALKTLGTEGNAGGMNDASNLFSNDKYWNVLSNVKVTNNKLTVGIKTDDENNWTIWDNFELVLTDKTGLQGTESSVDAYLTADDGTTYIYRGADSGTQGIVSAINELYATITTNIAGISTITFKDKLEKAGGLWGERLFLSNEDGGDGNVYTDGKRHVEKNYHHHYWKIDGNKLRNIEYGKYLGVKDGVLAMVSEEEAAEWTFDPKATETELQALKSKAEGDTHVFGFEEGEYAPYNNIAGTTAVAEGAAIDVEKDYPSLKIAAQTAALDDATTWTANTEEVNAFYDGDFSECVEDNASPLDYTPSGWTASENFRMMLKSTETYPGLADASIPSAVFTWSGGITYGEQTGYEMPLKANTIYTLKFKAAGWENQSRSGMTVSVLNGTDGMALYDLGTPDRDIKGNEHNTAGMTSYEYVFATGAAGNYVFHIQSGNNMVMTDFEIKKAASQVLEFADGALPKYAPGTYPSVKINREFTADKWSTAVYPFAVNTGTIATLKSFENGELAFQTATTSEANVPFMIKNDGAITLENVEVAAAAATDATAGDASLKGVYIATEIDNTAFNYVLKDNKIYKVGTAGATINPYRAYIQLTAATARLTFTVDGEVTAIEGVAADKTMDGTIYNLNGQRVKTAKKGVYVVNGKAVIVK